MEIIAPQSVNNPGPLGTYLQIANGLNYHLCFECPDLPRTLAALAEDNHRVICISEPKPTILFGGRPVSCYRVRGFGTIEILANTPASLVTERVSAS